MLGQNHQQARFMASTRQQKRVPARFALQSSPIIKHSLPKNTITEPNNNSEKAPISLSEIREKVRGATFAGAGLRPDVCEAISQLGITKPSTVQALSMEAVHTQKSVMFAGETGSGKTLAYLAPIISKLKNEEDQGILRLDKRPRAVVILPSKELVEQVTAMVKSLSHVAKFRAEAILDRKPTLKNTLDGCYDMIISTPQKFLFHVQKHSFSLNDVRYLVIDEADTLMNDDFGDVMHEIMDVVTKHRGSDYASIFVSATTPKHLHKKLDDLFGVSITFRNLFNTAGQS